MTDYPSLIEQYLAGPDLLEAAVAGLSREQLLARPVPGKWSTLEVVAHLADFEPVLADRMKRIAALDAPPLLAADENLYAVALAYHERDLAEELAVFRATRMQMGRILRALSPETFERTGVHSVRGPLTLGATLAMAVRHVPGHLKHVADKRAALGVD